MRLEMDLQGRFRTHVQLLIDDHLLVLQGFGSSDMRVYKHHPQRRFGARQGLLEFHTRRFRINIMNTSVNACRSLKRTGHVTIS